MPQYTSVSQALTDRLHDQAQTRATRYAFLETDARFLRDQAAEVYTAYTFSRAEDLCRCTAEGVCTQAAMTLTGQDEQVTVVCSVGEDKPVWFITDMTGLQFPASVYIRATQARIEANRKAARA